MDTFEALDRAIVSTAGVVKGVAGDQLGQATPCQDWTVKDVLNHVVGTLWLADGMFADRAPERGVVPGGLPADDLVSGDPSAAYAEASEAALASARIEGTLTVVHDTPLGQMPGPVLAGFTTLDIFVHGWDVAKATGQRTDLDPELAEHVLAFARQAFNDGNRAPLIGPEIAAGAQAPVVDRLVAYLGRQP